MSRDTVIMMNMMDMEKERENKKRCLTGEGGYLYAFVY